MEGCNLAETPIPLGKKLRKNDEGPTVDSTLYKSLVGSLLYLTATRPGIMYAASLVSRFMESPKDSHWKMTKRILRYVAGTLNFVLWYTKSDSNQLSGYTDSDFAGSLDDRKNTSGHVFQLGTNLISWASKKQPIVSISSAEVEYVTATSASCQAIWLRRILRICHIQKMIQLLFSVIILQQLLYPKIMCFTRKVNTLTLGFISNAS
jgi:hypothetical protein